jgi:hypothetical protein
MNSESHKGYTKASVLDKTDWRRTIHQCMEHSVNTIKTLDFHKAIISLRSAVAAQYPGFDAESIINRKIKFLNEKYSRIEKIWDSKHQTDNWWDKDLDRAYFRNQKDEEIFTFIKNLLADKRILLYGSKETIGGDQMDLPGIVDE